VYRGIPLEVIPSMGHFPYRCHYVSVLVVKVGNVATKYMHHKACLLSCNVVVNVGRCSKVE
jgi:hypothetical protein